MNSERLRKYVLEELAFDPRVDASGIGVTVDERIVKLTGHVHSLADKIAVAEAVERVKGVRGVVLDVEVRCPPDSHVSDEVLVKRATDVLAWDTSLPKGAVKVTVDQGCLTLTGTVDWQFQRSEIENDLRCLAGVIDIANKIAIRSISCKQDVKRSIRDAMHRRADVQASNIQVDVDASGKVVLKGKVGDWQARNAVEDAAWLIAGVRNVDNRVRVR
ncbi:MULTISPECIES: BON domain-containing protein [Lysobacter]|uniref:BON domain-containing protein n=1 Tax=Lysobacter TaxID=68 RepID=UPI001F369445|nr:MULTISPECIES: BON domain-containing protein [Lysobacter]UJB21673.1 BON domain-containing protein [Lysobacter capsici]UJQ29210.1 BON domain-containing protein [Lysobacter gummosus]